MPFVCSTTRLLLVRAHLLPAKVGSKSTNEKRLTKGGGLLSGLARSYTWGSAETDQFSYPPIHTPPPPPPPHRNLAPLLRTKFPVLGYTF